MDSVSAMAGSRSVEGEFDNEWRKLRRELRVFWSCGSSCAGAGRFFQVLLTTSKFLTDIEVDYGHEVLEHSKEAKVIAITYDIRNGAHWRTTHRFESGPFSLRACNPNPVM